MDHTVLGSSGLEISRLGFGAWAAGGADWWYSWGQQDDRMSVAAIRRAVDGGVNWIDTAAIYGLGHSEEVVGRAVRDIPEAQRPLVFTKCGLVFDKANPNAVPAFSGQASSVRQECEGSLHRLAVDQIDLYQVHQVPHDARLEEFWGTMAELKREGKVRAIGLSNHSAELLEEAETISHVDAVQPPFSAVRRGAAADVVPWARQHGTGVIVYSPMQAGLLTGAYSKQRAAATGADDWRSRDPEFAEPALSRNLELARVLGQVADRHGVQAGAIAIAWVLAWAGVSGAIVGARSPEQVEGWLPADQVELSDDDLGVISAGIARTGAGEGPADPRTAAH